MTSPEATQEEIDAAIDREGKLEQAAAQQYLQQRVILQSVLIERLQAEIRDLKNPPGEDD